MSKEKLNKLLAAKQPFTASEARTMGIPYETLRRACSSGQIERISNGVYSVNSDHISEYDDLKIASKFVPYSVVCLLSALAFHELTTQVPYKIWLAIPHGKRQKQCDSFEIQYTSLSPDVYSYGIENHIADGMNIKVYSVAKTIADCFKFRNKIGLDVAIEALKDATAKQKATNEQIIKAAEVCHVTQIILPYMEAIV
jgi:predicted transcriptional regulator of viral defense system